MEEILKRLLKFRNDRDWEQFHTPKNLAISISVEAAELLEHFQWEKENEALSAEKKIEVGKEIADIFIYLLMMSNDLGIDLLDEAKKKIEENAKKYPVEKARGRMKKYNEL
jgi:NTP pyrophosphatase (non-canonical NTP hydrolase)